MLLYAGVIIACFLHTNSSAQQVISIRAGLVTYTAGCVYLNDQQLKFSPDSIVEFSNGVQLRTEEGLAEVQVGIRTFLRTNRRTQLQMENYSLTSTVLRLKRGSVYIEIIENYEGNIVCIRFGDALVQLKKEGLYRVDADGAELRVYAGKSKVQKAGRNVTAKGGKTVDLRTLSRSKFDRDYKDGFHYWAAYRSFENAIKLNGAGFEASNWELLFMKYFRNEHYRVRFKDEDNEAPYSDELGRIIEIQRQQIEDRGNVTP